MSNKDFKIITTNMKYFTKNYLGLTNKMVSVDINGVNYRQGRGEGYLSRKQIQSFEYLGDFVNTKGINLWCYTKMKMIPMWKSKAKDD